jgi:hypothetical protein
MQGDTAKARATYQDFLTLWKDADSDIPILKQAQPEYAKLQWRIRRSEMRNSTLVRFRPVHRRVPHRLVECGTERRPDQFIALEFLR